MARIDIAQMRQWQNGDVINAGEYNDERNLLALANNDTNDKANTATLNAANALDIVAGIQAVGLPAAQGSVVRQYEFTGVGGQTAYEPPTGFVANTNRVQVFKNGLLIKHTEPSNARIEFAALTSEDKMVVRILTDVPDIFEVDRLEDTLTAAEATWAQAQTAASSANTAAASANTAATQANTARDGANTAKTAATNAAADATNQAAYAKTQGDYAKAEGAKIAPKITEVNSAIASANTATTQANTAKTNADAATAAAQAATTAANTAASNANTKATLANDKATLANNAATAASAAALDAGNAAASANSAATAANTAKTNADNAAANANAKATFAQTSADNANASAARAETANTDARAAITDMQTQTQSTIDAANTATSSANTAASNANTKATYAQQQGDYAKAQGDLAAEIINGNIPEATPSAAGLMPAADKGKLDGIAANANNYSHPTSDGNKHVPATGTSNNGKYLKAGSTAGSMAWSTINWSELVSKPTTVATSGLTDAETTSGAQTKANTAEANAKAASFSRVGIRASSVDLDTYKESGEYALGSGLTNAPSGVSFGTLLVSNSSVDRITQIVLAPGQSKMFIRYGTGSTTVWTSWFQIESTEGAQARVDTHAALAAPHVSASDRTNWNAKETTAGAQAKVDSHANNTAVHVTSTEKNTWNNKANNVQVTTTTDGLMIAADKVKLNTIATGANNYTHPSTHPPSIIAQDASNRFVSDTEKNNWNSKETTSGAQSKADAALSAAKTYAVNAVAVSSSSTDPNTTLEAYVLSNHANSPGLGLYWHIETRFWSTLSTSANRVQTAIAYNTSAPRMFFRNYYSSLGWSSWEEVASTDVATTSIDGLMSSSDKGKLDGIATGANKYTHPSTHPATMIVEDPDHRFITDAEKIKWSGAYDTIGEHTADGSIHLASWEKTAVSQLQNASTYSWTTATLLNGWTTKFSRPLQFRKVGNMLHISGGVGDGTTGDGTSVFYLPADCRPERTKVVFVGAGGNGSVVNGNTLMNRMVISSSGPVTLSNNFSPDGWMIDVVVPL